MLLPGILRLGVLEASGSDRAGQRTGTGTDEAGRRIGCSAISALLPAQAKFSPCASRPNKKSDFTCQTARRTEPFAQFSSVSPCKRGPMTTALSTAPNSVAGVHGVPAFALRARPDDGYLLLGYSSHLFNPPFAQHVSFAQPACRALILLLPAPVKGWAERREARISPRACEAR